MLNTVDKLATTAIFPETSILDANDAPNSINNTSATSLAHPTNHVSCQKLPAADHIAATNTAFATDTQTTGKT